MKYSIALFVCALVVIVSCKKNNLSNIPQISSLSITPDSVKAGSAYDTVYMTFHFIDGDADIGNDPNTTNYDVYVIDSRNIDSSSSHDTLGYFFPPIDGSVLNPNIGAEGNCTIKLLAAFMIPRPDHPQGDTLHYTVYMKDRAGHASNQLTTPNIYIRP